VLSKDSLEGTQALWRLDVADSANNDHWWRLNDSHSLDSLLLVQLGTELVDITHNVGHTSLVANKGREVDWLGWVVLGEGLALAAVSDRTLLWQKAQRTMSWVFEFTMTHFLSLCM
jgi:hypothetical protein